MDPGEARIPDRDGVVVGLTDSHYAGVRVDVLPWYAVGLHRDLQNPGVHLFGSGGFIGLFLGTGSGLLGLLPLRRGDEAEMDGIGADFHLPLVAVLYMEEVAALVVHGEDAEILEVGEVEPGPVRRGDQGGHGLGQTQNPRVPVGAGHDEDGALRYAGVLYHDVVVEAGAEPYRGPLRDELVHHLPVPEDGYGENLPVGGRSFSHSRFRLPPALSLPGSASRIPLRNNWPSPAGGGSPGPRHRPGC